MSEQDEREGLICASHQRPVTLDDSVFIRHENGGYCDSGQFTARTLTRGQVMALLILARGEALVSRSG